MKIEPSSGFNNPMIDFSSTDLPVPDGPSRTLISPAGSVSVTSDQMFELPNDFERFLIPTSTPPIAVFSLPGVRPRRVEPAVAGLALCAVERRGPRRVGHHIDNDGRGRRLQDREDRPTGEGFCRRPPA